MEVQDIKVNSFELGDFQLASGECLRQAKLEYVTLGRLSSQKDNVIVYPTHFGGTHQSNVEFVRASKALDETKYFIVIPNMFGNGVSTSPSNAHLTQRNESFPLVSLIDNVVAQKKLVETFWGIGSIRMVYGWSMGGMQAYHWSTQFPEMVKSFACCCSSAKTSPINHLFLDGLKDILNLEQSLNASSDYVLKMFAKNYVAWAYSPAFLSGARYRSLGFSTLSDLIESWVVDHRHWSTYDLLAMLRTWMHGDISSVYNSGDSVSSVLAKISVPCLLISSFSDRYFSSEASMDEASHLQNCQLEILQSDSGHMAGSPSWAGAERNQIDAKLFDFLNSEKNYEHRLS